MNKKSELSKKAREIGRKRNCLTTVCILDTLMRLIGALPRWVWGRRFLLSLLFAMLVGAVLGAQKPPTDEFKA